MLILVAVVTFTFHKFFLAILESLPLSFFICEGHTLVLEDDPLINSFSIVATFASTSLPLNGGQSELILFRDAFI